VNFQGNVHFLSRVPSRQWSRGIHSELISDFCRNIRVTSFHNKLRFEEVNSCFYRKWIEEKEGLQRLKEEKNFYSFAIDNNYWFSGKKRLFLWRNLVCIGEILGGNLFAFPPACVLEQEIKDRFGGRYEIS